MTTLLRREKDGKVTWVRPRFQERDYEMPAIELARIRGWSPAASAETLLETYDGPFRGLFETGRFDRHGRKWVRFQSGAGWAFDVELEREAPGLEVVPVPPREAYELARARDRPGFVVQEDEEA